MRDCRGRGVTRPAPRAMRLAWSFYRSRPITRPWIAACRPARPRPSSSPLPTADPSIPADFLTQAAVSLAALRRAEDAFVDELFAAAPALGMPLLAARFPRSYVDANREPYELDPGMFEGPLPRPLNHRTTRVAAGLGMIPRVAASGEAIYRGRVPSDEIEQRLETCWRPYHTALSMLVEQTYSLFGGALLVDAHSMPSSASGMGLRERDQRVDVVLGDNHGEACAAEPDRLRRALAVAARPAGSAQPALCRRLHHPALRPAQPRPAYSADRDQSRALHGRGTPREAAEASARAERADDRPARGNWRRREPCCCRGRWRPSSALSAQAPLAIGQKKGP